MTRRVQAAVWAMLGLLLACSDSATQPDEGTESDDQPSAAKTIGLLLSKNGASPGYTLMAPKHYGTTYLLDMSGDVVRTWTSAYPPGQSAYLLPNGNLLRAAMVQVKGGGTGGGEGGRIEEYTWEGTLVWEFDWATSDYQLHHDIAPLPNGNVLALMVERKSAAEAEAAGIDPALLRDGYILPDAVVEVKPNPPKGGTIVWEWHVWDHLVQNSDPSKATYGDPKLHPELVAPALSGGAKIQAFWNHMNSIAYNAALDQIMLSVRGNSEIWIIDHSTTTAQARGHTGGRYGKGGDLLYRWGNPVTYRAGTASDQRYFQQHDVEWVRPGYPGAGNLTCFNNGLGRGNYSTVDEFTPAIDANGDYPVTPGSAFGPRDFTWSCRGTAANPMYSENISGAHRLPNGNTIICSGTLGLFLEVTPASDIVWKYICPVDQSGPMRQGTSPPADPARTGETMNSVFRVYKYAPTYAAFLGRTLVPGNFIELY